MKVLFQGDSITDMGRDRSDFHDLGNGYAKYAARWLRHYCPEEEFEFIDLGISGNKTSDLVARWKTDCIDIAPDILSILIGINDTWHRAGDKNWIPNDEFENNYRTILEDAKKIDGIKIVMMEQFLLPREDWEYFREDIDPKIRITRKLAREYADVFIPLDGLLEAEAIRIGDYHILSEDAVHPAVDGAKFIGQLWAEAVAEII